MTTEEERLYQRNWARQNKEKLRAAGKCVMCGQRDPAPNRKRCEKCLEWELAHGKKRRVLRNESGLCSACGNPPEPGLKMCAECREKTKVKYKTQALPRRRKAIEAGLCQRCKKQPALPTNQACEGCWFYLSVSRNRDFSGGGAERRKQAQELRDLWEAQGHLCALTGAPIAPGNGMSIDHKIPKALGGGHEISNLQWVTKDINSFKRDLTPERFVELCREVVTWADRERERA